MELTCPVCGSEEVYRVDMRRKIFAVWYLSSFVMLGLAFVPVALPFVMLWAVLPLVLPMMERLHCRGCGHRV